MALFSNTSIYGTANVNSTLAVTAGIPSTSPITGSVIVTGGAGVSGNVSATKVFSNNVDILNFAQAVYAQANTNSVTETIIQGVDNTQNTNITAMNTFATSAYGQANTGRRLAQAAYDTSNTIPAMVTNAQGVDATQNTNITAMNTFAAGAYAQANTGTTLAQAVYTTSNNWVSVGGTTIQTGSTYFNSSSWLTAPNTPAVQIGSGDFTIEAWVFLTQNGYTNANETHTPILALGNWFSTNPGSNVNYSFQYDQQAGGKLTFGAVQNSSFATSFSNVQALPLFTWNHLAVTRNSGTINFWFNGVNIGSDATTFNGRNLTFNISNNNNLYIGRTSGGGYVDQYPWMFPGYMSNVRLSNNYARYSANFTPSTTPFVNDSYTSLLTCQSSSTITDTSTNAITLTQNGSLSESTNNPFVKVSNTGATVYSGSNYLSAPASVANLASNDFTIEGWYNFKNSGVGYQPLASNIGSGDQQGWILITESNSNLYFYGSTNSGWNTILSTGYAPPANQWLHIALVRQGSTFTLYVNGQSKGSVTSSNNIANPSNGFRIGDYPYFPNGERTFAGLISNFRITLGTAVYTSNFTPSTTPLTAVTGTSLLACQDQTSATVDNSGNSVTITSSGTSLETNYSPFQSGSIVGNSVAGLVTLAYNQANTGTTLAQAAYGTSNTNVTSINTIIGVNSTQNTSISSVNTFATSAYGQANTATAATVYNQGVDATQNTNITSVNTFANAAYASANTKLPLAGSYTGTTGSAGGSVSFNGNSSLTVPSTSALSFGTGNFTIECWVNFSSVPNHAYGLIDGQGSYTPNFYWDGGTYSTNTLTLSGRTDNQIRVSFTPIAGVWYHLAAVRNGTTFTIYANGVSLGSATSSYNYNGTGIYTIGGDAGAGSSWNFNGYISNMRITGSALYNSSFTPSTTPLTAITGTQLLTCQSSSSITDASTNGFTLTNVGGATASAQTPFTAVNTYSLTYPITGNLSINQDLQISGNLTTSGAITSLNSVSTEAADSLVVIASNNTAGDTSDIGFAAKSNDGTTTSYSGVIRDAATKEFYVYQGYTGDVTGNNVDTTDASFAKGTLNANNLKGSLVASSAIVNGRELGAYTSTVYAQSNTGTTLAQAAFNTANTDAAAITVIQGVDNTQNTNIAAVNTYVGSAYDQANTNAGAITVIQGVDATQNTDIASATALAQAAFNYANTVLPVLNTSTTFTDITLNTNDALTSGNVIANVATAVSSGSVSFNGTSQYLTVPNNAVFNLGSTFTIEFWLYRTSTSAQRVISRQDFTFPYNGYDISYGEVAGKMIFDASGTKIMIDDALTNQWVHYAWVCNAGNGTVYRNGVSVGTVSGLNPQVPSSQTTLAIGYRPDTNGSYLSGYLSNFRMINGTAVYTSAFTPSTTPLTAISGTSLLTAQSSSTITDASTNALTITNNGATASAQTPFTAAVSGPTVIDSFSSNAIRSAKYEIQMTSGANYHVVEVRIITDGNNAWLTQYGDIHTGVALGTISGSMASGIFSLTITPVTDGTVVRFYRSALKV